MLSELRAVGEPVLLVSGGDVYGGSDAYNRPKCQFIARMMDRFAYDAVALGETDLDFGLDALVDDSREFHMNVLCANVFRKKALKDEGAGSRTPPQGEERAAAGESGALLEKEPVFPAYRVVEKGGVRIGVIAVLSPAAKNEKAAAASGDVEALTYVVKAPLPILAALVPVVKTKADFIVLLAHMKRTELEGILADVTGVDMVVLGHSGRPEVTSDPILIGNVPVYMASHQGQYLGRAVLTFDSEAKVVASTNEIRLLDATVKNDPEVAALVKEFEDANRSYQKELFVKDQLQARTAKGSTQDIYLGLANCQRCHLPAFEAYIRTKHATAYSTLSAMFMHRDSGCVPCHSTGYGAPGGFSGVRMTGSAVDLVDVQCEACHGPAAEHSRDGRYKERARESCVKCHTSEQDATFDYEKAWAAIAH